MMKQKISRRSFVASGLGMTIAGAFPSGPLWAGSGTAEYKLNAGPGRVALTGNAYNETTVWSYNGKVPGPELRMRQGERLKFTIENRLAEETTVHSHGLRLPNAMDGVPGVTQRPIAPGETYTYEFDVPDAGTYWYHPHSNSAEQMGRGLAGPIIVEERQPITVDRDVTWVLDDWRLQSDGAIVNDFGNRMDAGMGGRLGNTVTINGSVPDRFVVHAGERIRLRLINTANARIFGLDFGNLQPRIIAYDGQPVEPHAPQNTLVVLGPAMRVDLILDVMDRARNPVEVIDRFYQSYAYKLVDMVYSDEPPIRTEPLGTTISLPANTMPEPDLARAQRHEIAFGGGMMGGGMTRNMMRAGKMWTVNGIAFEGPVMEPLLTLSQGETHLLRLRNATAWFHPIHLHGHSFRVIARNGVNTRFREWQDTVLMGPRETVDIAFVADNPGDWMFHCHIAEHLAAGMMGILRVA